MSHKEVHIGDDWYLGENDDGDLIFYNVRKDEVVKAIDVITGAEDKKGKALNKVDTPITTPDEENLETLEEVGYEKGDYMGIDSFNYAIKNFGTTSTSYNRDINQYKYVVRWDKLAPSSQQIAVLSRMNITVGTDETVDVRLNNNTDSEIVHELTGVTSSQQVILGWTDYTPSTTSSLIELLMEIRTNPGTNTSSLKSPQTTIGVKI